MTDPHHDPIPQLLMRRADLDHLPAALPPDGVHLRPRAPDDTPALAALLRDAFDDDLWTSERVEAVFLHDSSVVETLVAAAPDGALLATASARLDPVNYPGDGYVHWVAAAATARGQGLGRLVTLATLHAFRRHACTGAVLETDDHRLRAIRVYLGLGFAPVCWHESHAARWSAIRSALR